MTKIDALRQHHSRAPVRERRCAYRDCGAKLVGKHWTFSSPDHDYHVCVACYERVKLRGVMLHEHLVPDGEQDPRDGTLVIP